MASTSKHAGRTVVEGIAIAVAAFGVMYVIQLVRAPFLIQQETAQKASEAKSIGEHANSDLLNCRGDLKASDTKATALDGQVHSQQTLLNGQQSTVNKQQSTVNTCVVALAKANIPTPPKYSILMTKDPDPPATGHQSTILLLTTKPITPVTIEIGCEKEVTDFSFVPANGSAFGGSHEPVRDKHSTLLALNFPAWTPDNPILVRVRYQGDDPGQCGYHVK